MHPLAKAIIVATPLATAVLLSGCSAPAWTGPAGRLLGPGETRVLVVMVTNTGEDGFGPVFDAPGFAVAIQIRDPRHATVVDEAAFLRAGERFLQGVRTNLRGDFDVVVTSRPEGGGLESLFEDSAVRQVHETLRPFDCATPVLRLAVVEDEVGDPLDGEEFRHEFGCEEPR